MEQGKKAIFLDRDGVINELVYHREQEVIDSPFTVKQFRLKPGVSEAICLCRAKGYLAIVISNQPGIAKKQMSLATFNLIREKMTGDLAAKGAVLDAEYYCLHHPEAVVLKYRQNCDCRKPEPGSFFKAASIHNIDLSRSWFIGDNLSDVEAGKNAGCQTVLLGKIKCDLCNLMSERNIKPDRIFGTMLEAVQFITT
ncbi:MAG: HAD family hydrolase [Dehalococcoidales bacterium]|nr:HAD family hydrolase [Dehalococcoidales bacterium]